MSSQHRIQVSISGMTCNSCVKSITQALQELPGVDASSVAVDLNTGQATLLAQDQISSLVISTIQDLGYEATGDNNKQEEPRLHVTLSISGMTCSHCCDTIQHALSNLPGVVHDSIHVTLGSASLFLNDPHVMTKDQLAEAIEDLGYDVDSVRFEYMGQEEANMGTAPPMGSSMEEHSTTPPHYKIAKVSVSGMTCSHCTRTIAATLQALPGAIVESVQVDLGDQLATMVFQGDSITSDVLVNAIQDAGYDVDGRPRIDTMSSAQQASLQGAGTTSTTKNSASSVHSSNSQSTMTDSGLRKVVMRVIGMTCHSCVTAVTDALEHGVLHIQQGSIRVDLETEMAMFISRRPEASRVRQVVEDRGYDVENIQIIHNLLPPLVISDDPQQGQPLSRSATTDSIASLGAVSVDTPSVAVPSKVTMQISGMTCASCVRNIEQGLSALPGVVPESVKVNLLVGVGSFSLHGDVIDEETIEQAVSRMGYTASNISIIAEQRESSASELSNVYQADMIISGMFCMNCVDKVRHALEQLPGTKHDSINIDYDSGKTSFQYNGNNITRERIRQAILQLGFMAESIDVIKLIQEQQQSEKKKDSSQVSTRLTVTGMTCSSCVANIERAILKQPGIFSCQVNLLAKSAVVQHDPAIVGARALANMIEQLGYKAELAPTGGMDTLMDQREAMRASLNKEIGILKWRFYWSLVFAIPIVIFDMIFMMGLPQDNPVRMAFETPITDGLMVGDVVSFLLATPVQFWLGWPFYVKAYRSLRYTRSANMETLVAMGTTVAYCASVGTIIAAMARHTHKEGMNYFETSVLLITFIHFGKWLEALAKGKTAETITKLMDLQPDKAILVEFSQASSDKSATTAAASDDETTLTTQPSINSKSKAKGVIEREHVPERMNEREIDANDIQVGDILKVNAGARIPCDGKLWRGTTSTDESMITGESVPVSKKEGDDVITATINLSSPIYIRAIRVGSDTTLSRIIQLVQDAQASPKAPIEYVADRISSVFVPVVIVLALITFIIWEVATIYDMYPDEWVPMGGDKTTFSVMLGVSVLVIACPCGLGLASPTAVMVGTGIAARHGVLVKGGGYALEMASRITTIAFDKTGTLTQGKPVVTDSWTAPTPGASSEGSSNDNEAERERAVWKLLGRVTSASNHPLSKAIAKHAKHVISPYEQDDEEDEDGQQTNDEAFAGVTLKNAKEVAGRGVLATLALSSQVAVQFWPPHHRSQAESSQERLVNVFLGNQEWMNENRARYANKRQAQQCQDLLETWQNGGKSIVLLAMAPVGGGDERKHADGCNDECSCVVCRCSSGSICCSASRTMIVGQVAVADIVRPEAKGVVAQLRKQGIEVWMITGDNERTGRVIAEQLSIDKDCVLAGVKPEQKADKIRNLQQRGGVVRSNRRRLWKKNKNNYVQPVVAMVGDGINDSPSLAQADVGISVGSATDVAIEAASIVLIRNSLWDLLTMYDVSRAVVRRIRINFVWAFAYNVTAIPIAAGILYPGTGHGLPTYVAGIAMVASSISVVCSSLLLRLYRAPKFVREQQKQHNM